MTTEKKEKIRDKEPLAVFDARRAPVRVVLIAGVILALVFGWFSIRWQLGNMLAMLTPTGQPNAKPIAESAVNMSPSDPLTNWFAASVEPNNALGGFEKAVKLAPYNYTWWIHLGRAFEEAGDAQKAEKALLQAVKLAPNYTLPRWHLGNFYLRQEKEQEAFTELKRAAETDAVYREQVFSIVWDYYDNDTSKVEELAGNSSAVKASLARFYALKGRPDESLRVWNSIPEDEKQKHQEFARLTAQGLFDKYNFRSAVQFIQQLGIEPDARAEAVENGGFETPISNESAQIYFGWRILPVEKVAVNPDPNQKHEGTRSLRLLFTGFSGNELSSIYQIIAVQPGARYRLSYWFKTENLKSAGTPTMEVLNTKEFKILATGKPFPTETNDWQQTQIEFDVPETTEGVTLRSARNFCGNQCPIFGTVWIDDFKLEKIK